VDSLIKFVAEINRKMGIDLPTNWRTLTDPEIARRFLSGVNEYFFQTHADLGTTVFQEQDFQYFSEFHKFWEANHAEILDARINETQCRVAAKCLANAVSKYGRQILSLTANTHGLGKEAVAQVRFLTANQDFREPPEDQFGRYLEDPTEFDASSVHQDPAAFLHFLGMTRLSQTDKRLDFAKNAALFLVDKKIKAFGIAGHFGNNAVEIREALVNAPNLGYGSKKANMFIRDMVELGVWPGLSHYDEIDVASDINTMKLALRTRILQTNIPLLSSFLDIFCWQYSYIDEMSAAAWRRVWELWTEIDARSAPRSPCLMDFMLYRIGREYCDDDVVEFRCERGHAFLHFGARLKNCKLCMAEGRKTPAKPGLRVLPCQVNSHDLPRENGKLLLSNDNLLTVFDGVCIFENSCEPKARGFRSFDPPKSISIKGQTGWTNSYADRERGGGGMMG
jgi:hypothetical protein